MDTWRGVLGQKYLTGLRNPQRTTLEVTGVTSGCSDVRVAFVVDEAVRRVRTRVVITLGPREGGSGLLVAHDVSIEGVSLAETWRHRISRIYRGGGPPGVERQMSHLRARYGLGVTP